MPRSLDDRALRIVLDDEPMPDDPALAEAVHRARRNVDRIVAGLHSLAGEADGVGAPAPRKRSARSVAALAAVVLAVSGIAVAIAQSGGGDRRAAPIPTTQGGPSLAAPAPALSLDQRVRQADRIVVGTITGVDRGTVAEMPYVLATIAISESIKPAGSRDSEVVAFDYDLGGLSSAGPAPPWTVGDRVLLFLVSDAGTVSEQLRPVHLQVAEGTGGRYRVADGGVDAPFTLDDVRALARAS